MSVTSETHQYGGSCWTATETNSISEPIPTGSTDVGIDLQVISGTAIVQATSAARSLVVKNNAVWSDWDKGALTVNADGAIVSASTIMFGSSYVRLKAINGTAIMSVRNPKTIG